jgi:GAF domain
MDQKPYRFGLLIIGLLVTAGLGYRAAEDETSLDRAYREGVAHDRAAGHALEALLDLRASLHAYVAPGQGVPFWSKRAQATLDSLREQLVVIDAALTPQRASVADTLDTVDKLAAAERRTREHARRGEALLAGDIVFTEVRDLLSESIEQVQTARNTLNAAANARASALRREQAMLAGVVIGVWAIIASLLVTPTKPVAVKDPGEWRNDLAATIKKPIPKEPETAKLKPVEPVAPAELVAPPPAIPSVPVLALQEVGEICADLSTLADTGALTGALDRAARVLDASGMIVWIASNDGNSLSPVASHGFDQKMVSRIGRIPRDSANLTAAAFRENVPRVSAATATAPAALAVALCGPTGPVGVLSVELKSGLPADEGRVALTMIFGAQLATLAQPIAAAPAAPVEPAAPAAPASRVAL